MEALRGYLEEHKHRIGLILKALLAAGKLPLLASVKV